jgi:hypothetical protein
VFDHQESEFSQIIEESLKAVLSGKSSIEDVLRKHPGQAAQLRRELEVALWLHSRREQVAPRPGFVSASKKRVLARIQQEAGLQGTRRAVLGFRWPFQAPVLRLGMAVLVVLVLVFSGLGGAVSYAQRALPGEQLYGVKRAAERVSYGLAFDEIGKLKLNLGFAQRRLDEVQRLLPAGKYALVKSTLADFLAVSDQAVQQLRGLDDSQLAEKSALAKQVNGSLSKTTEVLASLVSDAPAEVKADLEKAHAESALGAAMAMEVFNELNDGTVTPTPVPTDTITVEPTIPATPSVTFEPTLLQPTDEPVTIQNTPVPSGADDTNTPKPKNTHQPTNPGNPPTKEPNDPKGGKPTKSDKNNK